ncbi:transcription factor JUNGBRUNNEN 1 [Artemisia annua]|uniref:Transcription factor JUNGBRUNNEN 1 n=1 Tax=Artemisia annua TaxID=35608 RepID=A0A2U1NC51_ARTAN|nr:transcription factor JUNGBRUNNEN 1 [Artemisia annua]
MSATSPPLGYQFDPEDYELINVLNHKLQNKPIPFDQITHLDLYSNYPWTLLHNTQPAIKRTKEHVIYTPRHRITGSTQITRRVLGGKVGIWKQVSDFECRCDENGKAVGKVTSHCSAYTIDDKAAFDI